MSVLKILEYSKNQKNSLNDRSVTFYLMVSLFNVCTIESVPCGGLNLMVVPVDPAAAPKAPPPPNEEAPNMVPPGCWAVCPGWVNSEEFCVGWACGWPKRPPLDEVAPKPKAGFACAPKPVLAVAPKRLPPVDPGAAPATAGWAAAPNMPVEGAWLPNIPVAGAVLPKPISSTIFLEIWCTWVMRNENSAFPPISWNCRVLINCSTL